MLRTPVVRNVGVTSVGGSLTGGPNTYTTLENKPDGRKTRFLEVECNRLPKDYIFSIAEKTTEPKKYPIFGFAPQPPTRTCYNLMDIFSKGNTCANFASQVY